MKKTHIYILASVTAQDGNQEGIPVSLMEAMATGLPVISTRHSGIPELVQDGISGFLVPERNVDSLVSKCEYLITHPEQRVEMGRAGREFVEENFNIRKLNRRLLELYLTPYSIVSQPSGGEE
jgi:colanic acid/amylovoran biosynthesis glycosyltransferase